MNETHHLLLGISAAEKGRQLQCVQRLADKPIVHGTAALPEGPVQLQVDATPRPTSSAGVLVATRSAKTWRLAGPVQRAHHQLSTETSSGFTGVPGPLRPRPSGGRTPADFAWVDFEATGD